MMRAKDALQALIAAAKTPAQLERLAAELRELSTTLAARAAALRHEEQRPAPKRLKPRKPGAGPGRAPGDFVRIERIARPLPAGTATDRDVEQSALRRSVPYPKLRLLIGKALYYDKDFGAPPYVGLAMRGGALALLPFQEAGEGRYRIIVGSGIPRTSCDSARGILKDHPDARYNAEVRDGVIVVGAMRAPPAAEPDVEPAESEAEREQREVAAALKRRARQS